MKPAGAQLEVHLERLRARIGEDIGPFHHDVEKGALLRFAAAVGETSRLFTDEAYAKTTRFRGLPAVPTYMAVLIRDFVDGGVFDRDLPLKQFLHTDDIVVQHLPIIAGDRLEIAGGLADAYVRDGRNGPLLFQLLAITVTNQTGQLVGTLRLNSVSLD